MTVIGIEGLRGSKRLLAIVLVTLGPLSAAGIVGSAAAQPPSAANGAKRFDDLRELNNKLSRTITRLEGELRKGGSIVKDIGRERRTLNDLEATKLRAVDQFPDVFGRPYSETFIQLSCIDDAIAVGKTALHELERGYLKSHFPAGEVYASHLLLNELKGAQDCNYILESELSTGAPASSGVSGDLHELNNKLSRAITRLEGELRKGGSIVRDIGRERRTLNDLETTKLRAVDQFPEILDPPYRETFVQLSCIDDAIAVGKTALHELERGYLKSHFPAGEVYASHLLLNELSGAKECKDALEVGLQHSFDLKPSEETEVGVNATTPTGTDTRNPFKLNAPKLLATAYAHDGFVGRHEHDYVAAGVNGGNPDSWPQGRNVLFFDVFDLFSSTGGARKAEKASEKNLRSTGFAPIQDSSLGSGEAVLQRQPAGSQLLSTIIYVQRGTFILKIAGACKGCTEGSIESSLESVARTQLARAVTNGFPASSTQPRTIPEEFDYSGSGGFFGEPGRKACIYLSGPIGQTGDVKLEPGDATARTDPNAQTYDQPFTLDSNGKAFLTFTEPNELFKVTINRKELDGSTNTTVTSMTPQIHHPPPWGLPDCTQ